MWSSSRNGGLLFWAVGLIAAMWTHVVLAQSYFVPNVEFSSEYHTNRELTPVPGQAEPTTGYIADAQALIGKRTQRSQTELRPRIRFQTYTNRGGVDPVDAFLDLQSDFRTLRGKYKILASASRQDTFNAEFGQATIETTGPQVPATHNDTGIIFVGIPRTEFLAQPSMEYSFTERTSFSAIANYDKVDYGQSTVFIHEDYRDSGLVLLLNHELQPLSVLGVGPYVTRYEAPQTHNVTDSAGLAVRWERDVSQISHVQLLAGYERTRITDPTFVNGEETQNNWRGEFRGWHKGQVSRFDYYGGHYLAGSGLGSRMERNEAGVQYQRQMAPRWDWRGALRVGSEARLGTSDKSRDRDYVRGELFVRWFMTQTMYVSGGYRYSWQKYKTLTNSADDNAALILFGFQGLDIRRSAVRGGE